MVDIKYEDIKEEDILDAIILAKQFHKEAQKAEYGTGFDNAKVTELISTFILSEDHKAFFIVVDGERVGFFVGCVHESMFSHDVFATEIFWWLDKAYRGRIGLGAIKVFEDWAMTYNPVQINMSDLQGLKSLGKVYTRLGYKLSEISYRKETK